MTTQQLEQYYHKENVSFDRFVICFMRTREIRAEYREGEEGDTERQPVNRKDEIPFWDSNIYSA